MSSAPPPPSSASTTTAPAMIGIQGIRRCGRATTVGGETRTVAALSRPWQGFAERADIRKARRLFDR